MRADRRHSASLAPVQNPQELVVLARNPSKHQSYTGLIAYSGGGRPVGFSLPGRGGAAQLVALTMVSGNYFDVLGVQPAVGRLFKSR